MGVKQDVLFKERQIYMVDADVARLTAALIATFPSIRFVERDYWDSRSVRDVGPSAAPPVPYRPALTDTRDHCRLRVWLEPGGWQPDWLPANERGSRLIANEPKPLLLWHPPVLREGSWDGYTGRNTLEHATVVAQYAAGDDEHLHLIKNAWRLLKPIAVNNIELCQNVLEMEAVLGPVKSQLTWIGHAALKWLYEDRQRVIWNRHRPCDAIDRAPGWWS